MENLTLCLLMHTRSNKILSPEDQSGTCCAASPTPFICTRIRFLAGSDEKSCEDISGIDRQFLQSPQFSPKINPLSPNTAKLLAHCAVSAVLQHPWLPQHIPKFLRCILQQTPENFTTGCSSSRCLVYDDATTVTAVTTVTTTITPSSMNSPSIGYMDDVLLMLSSLRTMFSCPLIQSLAYTDSKLWNGISPVLPDGSRSLQSFPTTRSGRHPSSTCPSTSDTVISLLRN